MLVFQSKVTVYNAAGDAAFVFPYSSSITIETSRNTFTDTATVTIPNKLRQGNSKRIQDVVKVGNRITIQMRYVPSMFGDVSLKNWNTNVEFDGYVSKVNPDAPMVIYCEDEMFQLKRKSLAPKYFSKVSFSEIMEYLAPGYEKVVQDANIGEFKTEGSVTPVDAFDALRKNFNTYIYFRGKVLYCEILPQTIDANRTIELNVNRNVPIGGDELTYKDEADTRTVVYVYSKNTETGQDISRYYAYKDNTEGSEIIVSTKPLPGNVNKFKSPNLTAANADVLGKRYLQNLWYTGVEGTIETFGEPSIIHGDAAKVVNLRVNERDGIYRVASVTKTFTTTEGYRQIVQLSKKIN